MTKIIRRALPNTPSANEFVNAEVRKVVSQLMENIKSLKKQIEELQFAVEELRR